MRILPSADGEGVVDCFFQPEGAETAFSDVATAHTQIVDQAKEDAVSERKRQVSAAEADIAQAANQAREELRATVANLAVLGASQILEKEVDANTHRDLLDKLIAEI